MTAGTTRDILCGMLFDPIDWSCLPACHDGSITPVDRIKPLPDAKSASRQSCGSVLVSFSVSTALFFCVGGGSNSSGSSTWLYHFDWMSGLRRCSVLVTIADVAFAGSIVNIKPWCSPELVYHLIFHFLEAVGICTLKLPRQLIHCV